MKKVLANEVKAELLQNIYPFWSRMARQGDSFPGRIDAFGNEYHDAPKSAVMVMRMLWAFSAIAGQYPESGARKDADLMYDFVKRYFLDREMGGVYWALNADNSVENPKKQSYAIGFAIYALSRYNITTGCKEALDIALGLFQDHEEHCWDALNGGYIEALQRDWSPIDDMRLSDKDKNSVFTMNTHLHILEPYTTLYEASGDQRVKEAIVRLLEIFCDRMYNPDTRHLGLFFDKDWTLQDNEISYGHDIEASWLMWEAINAVASCDRRFGEVADELVLGCEGDSYLEDGSMIYKCDAAGFDRERHWWVQAEAAVGLYKMYLRSEDARWLEKACRVWNFTKEQIVDREKGEWIWSRFPDGSINTRDDKAGFWKCPYHNSRMCLELSK